MARSFAGAGTTDTGAAEEKGGAAAAQGAPGVLSGGPYNNKPAWGGVSRHFAAIADASPVPVVVYNVPGRTGSNIDAKALLRLARHGNVGAVKEASGNLGQIMDILRDRPPGFEVLSGDDAFTLALMALGADGVISVAPNQVPRPMHDPVAASARGASPQPRPRHNRLLRLITLHFLQATPIPLKAPLA